ncbi:hypothetical protein [Micromonospora sp. KC721]|uniref:hypothetical protein n=1 Tax=Micromonospora sp. KC721 TaxID=2530380 RepID=UPI001A9F1B67|nr:hypothetical protein [Micromonospora sp. KC721]
MITPTGTVTGLALLCGAVVLVTVRSWRAALRVLLDLLVAAGLLRLAVDSGWDALATAAVIILLRRLLWAGLAAPVPVLGPGGGPSGPPPGGFGGGPSTP